MTTNKHTNNELRDLNSQKHLRLELFSINCESCRSEGGLGLSGDGISGCSEGNL